MRLPICLFAVLVVFLWQLTDSTSASSNKAMNGTRSFSTVPLRVESNTSVAPEHVHPAIHAVETADWIDEDRGLTGFLSRMADAVEEVPMKAKMVANKNPLAFLKYIKIHSLLSEREIDERLIQWFKCVDAHISEGHHMEDDEVVEHLVTTLKNKMMLIQSLARIRRRQAWKERVEGLIRAMAARDKKSLDMLARFWIKSKVRPDKVYQLMPISSMPRLTGDVSKEKEWRIVGAGLVSWLEFVPAFNEKYPLEAYDSESVATFLADKRGLDEATEIFAYVRGWVTGETDYGWQRELAAAHPETVKLMVPMWKKLHVEPYDVYEMLPVAKKIHELGIGDPIKWPAIYRELSVWFDYIDEFNSKWSDRPYKRSRQPLNFQASLTFGPDMFFIEKLLESSNKNDVETFLKMLRTVESAKREQLTVSLLRLLEDCRNLFPKAQQSKS